MKAAIRLPIALAALALGACATTPQTPDHLEPAHAEKTRVWPAPPEVPRYRFVGELTGEDNFVREGPAPSGMRKLFEWVTGLSGDDEEKLLLQRPQTGAVDEAGRIYVTDVSRQGVFVFDVPKGQLRLWEWAAPRQRFMAPVGIALSPSGRVWVADAELGAVVVLDARGNPQGFWGKGILRRPTGLAFDPEQGLLYVADTAAHDIRVFDGEGQLVRTIGRRGNAPGEFNAPTHLGFRFGRLYVADTLNARVQVLNPDGRPIKSIGHRGLRLGNMVRPKGVALDDEGNLYVVESYYDYLLIYDDQGRFLMPIGGTGSGIGEFYLPSGVWTDSRNRIFVADMFNGRVMIFQYLGERE